MVYLVRDRETSDKILMVKADDEPVIRKRLNVSDEFEILGRLTDIEINVLSMSPFVVIEA